MKVQHTNQTQLEQAASEQAWAVVELLEEGMSIHEAVQAQADGWMDSPYDENFDAPYNLEQIKPLIKKAVMDHLEIGFIPGDDEKDYCWDFAGSNDTYPTLNDAIDHILVIRAEK